MRFATVRARSTWSPLRTIAVAGLVAACFDGGLATSPAAPALPLASQQEGVDGDQRINTGPMTNGASHTGTISAAQQVDVWTFTATQGQELIVAMGEVSGSADFTPWLRLLAPSSALLRNAVGAAAAQVEVTAPETGTYTVQAASADPGNDGTGTYRLSYVAAPGTYTVSPGDQGGNASNAGNINGTISVGDVDVWTFTGTAGRSLIVALGEVSVTPDFEPWVRLIDPNGVLLRNQAGPAAVQFELVLPQTGSYTLVVGTADADWDASGTYLLSVVRMTGSYTVSPGDQGGPATNGGNDLGRLVPGDVDVFTFTAGAGTPFAVNIGEVAGAGTSPDFEPWIRVYNSAGALIGNQAGVAAAQVSGISQVSGQYTVVVSTNDLGNDAAGDYRLIVQKAGAFVTPAGDQGGPMTNGAIHNGTIDVGDLDRWTIAANIGETIVVAAGEVAGTDLSPWLRLVSPSGQVLANTSGANAAQVSTVATENGNYTIAISSADAGNDGTGTYTLTVAKAPGNFSTSPGDQGGPTSNGVSNGAIATGDLDMWSVDATAGNAISLTMTKTSGTADFTPWIRLVAPDGALIGNSAGTPAAFVGATATLTGTYTVILASGDPGYDGTGSYSLTVAGVSVAPQPNFVPRPGNLDWQRTPRPRSYGVDGIQ